ncbi:hypothetical protein PRIC1_012445 [Phytophthora ramorum]
MPRRDELASEAAAVAAFLSDISGFLDDEVVGAVSSNETPAYNVTMRTVNPQSEESKCPSPQDEAERKRVIRNVKTGKRRDAYRKRLKEEWRTLQCEEVELAAKLEEMQQRRRADSGGMARAAWRAIAMRQLEGRRVAAAQQEKLKAAVKRRRELIQDVEITLRKRLKEVEDASKTGDKGSSLTKSNRTEPGDEKLFEAYIDEMDAIYAKTDAVFRSCETAPMTGPFLNTKPPKKRDGDTEYLENLGVLHVPFEFKRTCSALWEVTRQPYRQLDREEYRGVENLQNTIAVRFRVKCPLHTSGTVSLLTHFVSRRYVEKNRTVIIWRELWEGEGEFEGMHSDETGWCTVQPREAAADDVVSPADGSDTASTLIRVCARLVPMHFSSKVTDTPDFDEFTEVLVTSGKEDNLQIEQMMERMQLGDALAEVSLRSPFPAGAK